MTNVNKTIGILAIAIFSCVLPGCKSKSDDNKNAVSPNLITNPITASGKKADGSLPVMVFETTKHDFGLVVQGEKLTYTFKFKNTGGSDLVISDATSTCGCTIPDWSKAPVKPGDEGKVEVVFNSAGKTGSNIKTVKLLTNCQPNSVELEISAEVYVPDNKK